MSDATVVIEEEPAPPAPVDDTPSIEVQPRHDARRFTIAFVVGALAATLLFAWTITGGSFDFSRRVSFGDDFYDVQARRLFDGHWDMPLDVVAVEGYRHDGKLYMYFGPVPAFLRMPLLAATDVGDGELTHEWMVAAFAVALAALGSLAWRIRRFVRGDVALGAMEAAAIGFGAFAIGAGSTLLYLGSGPWVYHEAILWGVAFSLAAFAALLAWVERPRWWVLGLAALFTALAVGSRLTVALGPVVALTMLGAVVVISRAWPWFRRRVAPVTGLDDGAISLPVAGALTAAAAVPIALYAWLNSTKFGTLFSVPYEHQLLNRVQRNRPQVLRVNHNSLFRLDAIPTALYQYFRPDAIGFRAEFPWVQFPSWKPTVFNGLLYDHLDRTSSIPASMPLLLGLGLIGIVVIAIARRRGDRANASALRVPALAALVAFVPSLAFIFLTQRYLGDAVPFLVLVALAGFFAVVAWTAGLRGRARILGGVAAALIVAVAGFGVLANFGMARDWQRFHLPPAQQFPADRGAG